MRAFLDYRPLAFAAACAAVALRGQPATIAKERWENPSVALPRVVHGVYPSAAMDVAIGYNIYLPEAYAQQADRRFPVVYYLHGGGGNESSHLPAFVAQLDAVFSSGRVKPMLYVFARGAGPRDWEDRAETRFQMETSLVRELIPFIDAHYRTRAEWGGRAIHGFSNGARFSQIIACRHPDVFGAMVSFSAGYRTGDERIHEAYRAAADAIRGMPRILFIGERDQFLRKNKEIADLLAELKLPSRFSVMPGVGHNPEAMWQAGLSEALEVLSKHFAAPR